MNLILRPTTLHRDPKIRWALQLRDHGPAETNYYTLARVDDTTAYEIIRAGAPHWLFGEPDDDDYKEAAAQLETRSVFDVWREESRKPATADDLRREMYALRDERDRLARELATLKTQIGRLVE